MIVFHADLDNTMIYSYRRDIGPDKKCVEIYEGRPVSFITRRTEELLADICGRVLFVPTTTRTVEQYNRIQLGTGTPPYALVCNGGVLLVDGQESGEWYEDSLRLVEGCQKELSLAEEMLGADEDVNFEVRNIRRLFLFTKSGRPQETVKRLSAGLDRSLVDVMQNGVKVYVVPKPMNKGLAVRRLRERLGASRVIAAGDSEFDIPMLQCADVPIAPDGLRAAAGLPERALVMEKRGIFAEFVLEHVREWMDEGQNEN